MSSSMFTFRNNVSQQMASQSHQSQRWDRSQLRCSLAVPCATVQTVHRRRQKKARPKAERAGLPYPQGGWQAAGESA